MANQHFCYFQAPFLDELGVFKIYLLKSSIYIAIAILVLLVATLMVKAFMEKIWSDWETQHFIYLHLLYK